MKNFYLIFMLVCFMGGMVLSAKGRGERTTDN